MKKLLLIPAAESRLPASLCPELTQQGYHVDLPKADMSLAQAVKRFKPDSVLLETQPEFAQEIYTLCKQIRELEGAQHLAVLLLGVADAQGQVPSVYYLLDGVKAGATDYLAPPCNFDELVVKITSSTKLKEALEQASTLATQLEELNQELYTRSIHVEKELYVARQLQQSLLPRAIHLPEFDEDEFGGPMYTKVHYKDDKVKISGIYFPCDALGGDLYDVIKLPDNKLGISITDVSGHGVPAGFITTILKTCLLRIAQQCEDPSDVLFHLNNELYDIIKTGDYVTGIYTHLDLKSMTFQCAGAGHPYPFYYEAKTGKIRRIEKNGTPLVWVKDMAFPKETLKLHPGDKVYMFTDGVSELNNVTGEMFGEDRVGDTIAEAAMLGVKYLPDHIIGKLSDFTEGAALGDDISMVLIEAL